MPLAPVSSAKTFDHDLAGRLVRETHLAIAGADRVLESVFWPDGSLRKKKLADGTWTGDYVYDRAGRLSSIANANPPSAAEPALFIQQAHYNARGQTTAITYGNGAVAAYGYNEARGWLTSVTVINGAATPLTLTYARNPKGLITAIASPNPAHGWTYAYDELDRLITADNGAGTSDDRSFAYDDADNLVWNSGLCAANPNLVYPAAGSPRPHAPSSICGTAVSYDANGNTTAYDADGSGPLSPRSLAYDLENRPIVISRNGIPASFSYGADSERVSKTWNGNTTWFLGRDGELLVNPANLLFLAHGLIAKVWQLWRTMGRASFLPSPPGCEAGRGAHRLPHQGSPQFQPPHPQAWALGCLRV